MRHDLFADLITPDPVCAGVPTMDGCCSMRCGLLEVNKGYNLAGCSLYQPEITQVTLLVNVTVKATALLLECLRRPADLLT